MANKCNNRSKLDLNKVGEHKGVQENIITLLYSANISKRNYITQNYVKCYEQNTRHNLNLLLLHTLYVKCVTKYINMLLQILYNSKKFMKSKCQITDVSLMCF
jgi:hypothetical protein